jgi:hypothetical protein
MREGLDQGAVLPGARVDTEHLKISDRWARRGIRLRHRAYGGTAA